MAKNKNRLSFEAQLARHPHDLSCAYSSSITTGCLVPQWYHVMQPGDKIIMKPKMFCRFQDIVKAFLGEVDVNIKTFFVPLSMIYTPYGQIFAQTNDVLSSNFKNIGQKDIYPLLNLEGSQEGIDPSAFHYGHHECFGKETARLYDALCVNPYGVLNEDARTAEEYEPAEGHTPIDLSQCSNPNVSPWLFAAYQAIYQKAFRNDEFEKFNIAAYNIDQYYDPAGTSPNFSNAEFIKLRYVQRPADYFTKVRVSPIASFINKLDSSSIGDNNVNSDTGGTLNELLSKVNDFLGFSTFNGYTTGGQSFITNDGSGRQATPTGFIVGGASLNGSSVNANNSLNVPNIRAAFALDKFLRVYGRAGKTYDDQILAHFGVKIPHDVKHDLTEISHLHVAMQAEPVYGTATIGTDNGSVLGQVGGQGQATIESQKEIKFTAPVHGVIMCVAYAVTKPRYYGTFDKLNLLGSRIDFPIPEFDKLGAEPVYAFEINPQALASMSSVANRYGWNDRYQRFKEKWNRCSFLYAPADVFGTEPSGYVQENNFMPWILSRPAFWGVENEPDKTMQAVDLWERPDALNTVMDMPYSGNWSNDYFEAPHLMMATDPIITDFYMDATLVSWISPTGEPDL